MTKETRDKIEQEIKERFNSALRQGSGFSFSEEAAVISFIPIICEALDKLLLSEVDKAKIISETEDLMIEFGPDGHCDGAAKIAEPFILSIAARDARISQLENELKHRGRECFDNEVRIRELEANLSRVIEERDEFWENLMEKVSSYSDLFVERNQLKECVKDLVNGVKDLPKVDSGESLHAYHRLMVQLKKHADLISKVGV